MSFRRATRSGPSDGLPIEDVGVAGPRYAKTRADLLGGNRDLIAHCLHVLREMPLTRLAFEVRATQCMVRVTTSGIERLHVFIDGVPAASHQPTGSQAIDVAYPAGARRMELAGVHRGEVVQRRLIELRA